MEDVGSISCAGATVSTADESVRLPAAETGSEQRENGVGRGLGRLVDTGEMAVQEAEHSVAEGEEQHREWSAQGRQVTRDFLLLLTASSSLACVCTSVLCYIR